MLEENEESKLFITEIEKLFGFPESFTDGPNLTVPERRKLLGRAFCVPVVQWLLAPLRSIFWTWKPDGDLYLHWASVKRNMI